MTGPAPFRQDAALALIEWWCDLSRKQKYLFSAGFIGISAAALLTSGRIWLFGWIGGGILGFCAMIGVGDSETD